MICVTPRNNNSHGASAPTPNQMYVPIYTLVHKQVCPSFLSSRLRQQDPRPFPGGGPPPYKRTDSLRLTTPRWQAIISPPRPAAGSRQSFLFLAVVDGTQIQLVIGLNMQTNRRLQRTGHHSPECLSALSFLSPHLPTMRTAGALNSVLYSGPPYVPFIAFPPDLLVALRSHI